MRFMKRFFYLFVITVFHLFTAYSQDETPMARTSSASDESGFRSLLDSANLYKSTDIDKSIEYVARVLEMLPDQDDQKRRAQALTTLGEIYQYHQQYDLAIRSFRDAQDVYKTANTALLLGEVLLQTKDYRQAENVLLPLIDMEEMVPYSRVLLFEYLGDAYSGLGDAKQAIAFYQQGLTIAEKNRISPKIPDLNSKIADVYALDNRNEEAEAYYDISLEQAAGQAPMRAVREKEKVADYYNRENRYEEEIKLRKKSLSELKSMPESAESAPESEVTEDAIAAQQINYKIGNAYVSQEKYDEAVPFLVESIRESEKEDDLETKKDATQKLSELYREKGDYTRALETYQEYVTLVDTLYKRKEAEIAQAARFNRELAIKQNRINSLEKDRELSESKMDLAVTKQKLIEESNRRQKWIIYSLILLTVLTALAAFFFYRSNQQQKLANNLLALRSLRTQMNPHFIFNALNSVNSYIALNDERSANKYLSDFSTLMRAVLENSEEDFIPLEKEMDLLRLYLKLEHSRFPDKFDYEIEVEPEADLRDFQIPPMLLQPYVENAVWHGLRYKEEKGKLLVKAKKLKDNTIQLVVEDDGIGRKASEKLKTKYQREQKSTGMRNIARRIEILNSMSEDKIEVEVTDLHSDGSGTRVCINIGRNS